MSLNIWFNGPEPEAREHALAEARRLGYKAPVVARVVPVRGSRVTLLGVIVADGEAEAEASREARRLGKRFDG